MNELRLTITAFSDPKKLFDLKDELDEFISKNSQNPFMHSAFVEKQMKSSVTNSATPLILVFTVRKSIVGFVPLLITKRFGVSSASFLFNYFISPDFILEDNYRQLCIKSCLNFILDQYHCKFVSFNLPADSPNFSILIQTYKANSCRVRFFHDTYLNHAVLSVQSTWETFQENKGKNFNKKIRQIERKIEAASEYKIKFFENEQDEEEVLHQIMEIERNCWKQDLRDQKGNLIDQDLSNFWEASGVTCRIIAGFKRRIWILYLNDMAIAYNLTIEYKGTSYMCKTSFNNKYRQLYPGVYLINGAIQDLFNFGNVSLIDFMTSLPFHERWTRRNLLRINITISNGFLPNLFELMLKKLPKNIKEDISKIAKLFGISMR